MNTKRGIPILVIMNQYGQGIETPAGEKVTAVCAVDDTILYAKKTDKHAGNNKHIHRMFRICENGSKCRKNVYI